MNKITELLKDTKMLYLSQHELYTLFYKIDTSLKEMTLYSNNIILETVSLLDYNTKKDCLIELLNLYIANKNYHLKHLINK